MGIFSSQPKNRRRPSRRKKPQEAWGEAKPARKSSGKKQSSDVLGERFYQINAQIGAIESFLAKKHAVEESRKRMKNEGILPPPEAPRKARKKPLSHAERRRYHAERSRTGLHFLFLFCLAALLVWWLVDSGI